MLVLLGLIAAWVFMDLKFFLLGWIPPMILGFLTAIVVVIVLSIGANKLIKIAYRQRSK